MDICRSDATELARLVRHRQVSAEEVVRAHLEAVDALDRRLNAFVTVAAPDALAAARHVDARVAQGEGDRLPLAGVPVALKDNLATRGLATTCGSRILAGWVPPYDATAVWRLREAGAVVLGKTNLDELAMGSSTETSVAGPCRNPWNPSRVAGGSSGGSAAAVSAGLCAAALGSDTGGSVRQPAALCGVTGLKPTYGRVSRYGLVAFASSLDQVGPLARTVEDCAALLQVIAGQDPRDSTTLPAGVTDLVAACRRGAGGLRLGVAEEYLGEGVEPEVAGAVRAAVSALAAAGAQVVEVSLPHTRSALSAYYFLCAAEASSNLARFDGVRYGHRTPGASRFHEMVLRTRSEGFGPEVKRRILLGTLALSAGQRDAYYLQAQRVRTLVRRDFDAAFGRCDVIAAPTSPVPAFRLGERLDDPTAMYAADRCTVAVSLAGLPALSVPCGFTAGGLPLGLQLMGPPLGEAVVLAAGAAYQRTTGWHRRWPGLSAGGGET